MSVPRLGAGVAACGGFLYVVGGYDGQTRWNTAERYQPDTNTWHQLVPMSTTRSGLGELEGRSSGAGLEIKVRLKVCKEACGDSSICLYAGLQCVKFE